MPDTVDEGRWKGRADVLSANEEWVLSEVREIVGSIRAGDETADLPALIEGVTRAGASIVSDGDGNGPSRFKRGGISFTLRSIPDGRFEIRFPGENP